MTVHERLATYISKRFEKFNVYGENIGGDLYFKISNSAKNFFTVEMNQGYTEFYFPDGHTIIQDLNDEDEYYQKVIDLIEKLIISMDE